MSNDIQYTGSLLEMPVGSWKEISVKDEKILLYREAEKTISAFSGTCPHAGAPLAAGLCRAGEIICPWHKAVFDARTGKSISPPAIDDLLKYRVQLSGDRFQISSAPPAEPSPPAELTKTFAIVGTGPAGLTAAWHLRRLGFAGRLVLLGPELPFDRTQLSKMYLSGQVEESKLPLKSANDLQMAGIELIQDRARSIEFSARRINLTDGSAPLEYDKLLIATGSELVPAQFPATGVLMLRSLGEAKMIKQAAKPGQHAIVIGSSFISAEVAASLRELKMEVTMVFPDPCLFAKQLGAEVGGILQNHQASRGVHFRANTKIKEVVAGEQTKVCFESGESLLGSVVIAGLGVRPATTFLSDWPTTEVGGLEVDDHLQVTQNVWAAGDIAVLPDGSRYEHWRNAQEQGWIAASNMLGQDQTYRQVPFYWTYQFGVRIEAIGRPSPDAEVEVRGDRAQLRFRAFYFRGNELIAMVGAQEESEGCVLFQLLGQHRRITKKDLVRADYQLSRI